MRPDLKDQGRGLAAWLYDYLKDGLPAPVGRIYDEAGQFFSDRKPNPLGVKDTKTGYWTMGRTLRRAADIDVPKLVYPRSGKKVEKYQHPDTNRGFWRLVDKDSETLTPF